MDRRDRTAFVTELPDDDEPGRMSGLFAAHWEYESGGMGEAGPEGVSVTEAIEWGRRHSAYVSVVIGGDDPVYTAGSEPMEECLPWPEDGIDVQPRPIGYPPSVAVDEADWGVQSSVEVDGAVHEDIPRHVRAALEGDPRVSQINITWTDDVLLRVRCRYYSRNGKGSVLGVDNLVESGLRSALGDQRSTLVRNKQTWSLGPAPAD